MYEKKWVGGFSKMLIIAYFYYVNKQIFAYFAYNVGGWVQKVGKMCLRNKSMTPYSALVGTGAAGGFHPSILGNGWIHPSSEDPFGIWIELTFDLFHLKLNFVNN